MYYHLALETESGDHTKSILQLCDNSQASDDIPDATTTSI